MSKYKIYKNVHIVVGMMFTVEAARLVRSLTSYFIYYDDNFWDDESYLRIKQGK